MRVVFVQKEIESGLSKLKEEFTKAMGEPSNNDMSFPGWPSLTFRTWEKPTSYGPLAVGFGDSPKSKRTLIMLVCGKIESGMTSTVEINIWRRDDRPNRRVNGCLCVDSESNFWLGHRGLQFTVHGYCKIGKDDIHERFSDWLKPVDDAGKNSKIIIIGQIGDGLIERMACFAYSVRNLKDRG